METGDRGEEEREEEEVEEGVEVVVVEEGLEVGEGVVVEAGHERRGRGGREEGESRRGGRTLMPPVLSSMRRAGEEREAGSEVGSTETGAARLTHMLQLALRRSPEQRGSHQRGKGFQQKSLNQYTWGGLIRKFYIAGGQGHNYKVVCCNTVFKSASSARHHIRVNHSVVDGSCRARGARFIYTV